MRKLMIAMLALAVVFGFAACDNSTANSGASQLDVAYIEAVEKTATDYLVGETPDPADFTFTGYDAAGNVVIENMASTLFSATKAFVKGDDEAVFSYTGAVTVPSIKVPVSVYEIEKITVDAKADNVKKTYYTLVAMGDDASVPSALTDTDYEPFTEVDKTGLVVKAVYNGTSEKVLDADDYTAVLGTVDEDSEDNYAELTAAQWSSKNLSTDLAGKDVVVKVAMKGASATDPADYYAVSFKANLISSIYVDIDEDYVIYYGLNESAITSGSIDKNKVVALGEMVNGQRGYKLSGVKYGISNTTVTQTDIALVDIKGQNSPLTVWAVYETTTNVVPNFKVTPVASEKTIPVVKDSIVGIEVTAGSEGFELDTDYSDADQTAPTGFLVNYKLASDKIGDELDIHDDYEITPAEFSSKEYKPGSPITVTVTAGSYTKTVETKIAN